MAPINNASEDELIRLLLKRQSELNSLLEVTQAINKNSSTVVLIEMLEVIMKHYLAVGKLRFLVENDGTFVSLSKYGGIYESSIMLQEVCHVLSAITLPTRIADYEHPVLKSYDYFIPIHHQSKLIAFALIGDFNTTDQLLNNDLNFIQTLINVIVVALENKKLFRERIQAERFHREMELAGEVQNMLIPVKLLKEEKVEVGARYLPHQNIGGDYFDFIRLNDNEFLWCIADVSGKGIAAALLMANLQASLRAWASVEEDLVTIVKKLNEIVLRNTKGERFITMFLGKYNEHTRQLKYINAGHNPPLLYQQGNVTQLKLGAPIIGIFDVLPFINQGEITLSEDALVFNYTDGLVEYNQDTSVWNEDHLMQFVKENGEMGPDEFNQKILNHIRHIIKSKPLDDITLLTLRIF
ncbi:MAG: PP2C family protein-serine/threonine phosphatase [Sphingobacteriaceae bacterium]